jgi:FkbM family methyltransferase
MIPLAGTNTETEFVIIMLKASIKKILPSAFKNWLKDSNLNFYRFAIRNVQFRYSAPHVYGQAAEDFLLKWWLPEKSGTFIDIGAGEPMRGSNTYAFYKLGWKGILVEPISENCKLLAYLRPRDQVLQLLVGNQNSHVDFYEFDPYQCSTTVLSVAEDLLHKSVRLKSVSRVLILPMSDFAPEMDPLEPTLLSIDVEGADLEVLESNDWSRTRPRVICVEELPDSMVDGAIEKLLAKQNYKRVTYTGLSSIYVEQNYLDYLKKLADLKVEATEKLRRPKS